jgi:ATP-dependent RNA helicase DeaD
MEQFKFKELNLSPEIEKAVDQLGFEETTPIQSLVIPPILEGKDIIGQAQTGTGKTAAFGIPVLEKVESHDKSPQALILCPTRELAIQVAEELQKLSKYQKEIKVLPIYGGQSIERQIKALKKGFQVIVGTPGRLMDHMSRGTLNMKSVKLVVLDEADEMLDMGFRDDIDFILNELPKKRQLLLFSATMSPMILSLTSKFQKNAQFLKVTHQKLTVPETEQIYFEVKEKMKLELLSRILDLHDIRRGLVFCNTKKKVGKLVGHLQIRGYSADELHGDLSQNQRNLAMGRFRNGKVEILVATDVAARGIDVNDIEAVFNYDVPHDEEYYVHRIGRTGRAGKNGLAFTFVSAKEIFKLRDIQRYTKVKIKEQRIPSLTDVQETKTQYFLKKIKSIINNQDLERYVHIVEKLMAEDYNSVDLAAALLMVCMKDEGEKKIIKKGSTTNMVSFYFKLGSDHKIKIKDILRVLSSETGLSSSSIGNISIHKNFSLVEVPQDYAANLCSQIENCQIKGQKLKLEQVK